MGIVALVALRITIGWHFFYEGVWKIANQDEFSAKPFLAMSKGPAAPMYHMMLPDFDGRQRLALEHVTEEQGAQTELTEEAVAEWRTAWAELNTALCEEGLPRETFVVPAVANFENTKSCNCPGPCDCPDRWVTSPVYEDAWAEFKKQFDAAYDLDEWQQKKADLAFTEYVLSLRQYCSDTEDDIVAHFGSLDRHESAIKAGTNKADHQKERNFSGTMKLRGEANGFIAELDGLTEEMQAGMYRMVPAEQLAAKGRQPSIVLSTNKLPVSVPFVESRMAWLDMSVTYGLTAIGLCLILGFCSRLAALGGAAFLVNVLLTQPPIPTIFPHAPAVVGHALIVDKNFVEMMALGLIIVLPAGRFAGLDFFLYQFLGKRVEKMYTKKIEEPAAGGHGVPAPKSKELGVTESEKAEK